MIEVTAEMRRFLSSAWKGDITRDEAVKGIIELHEANKPKPEPYCYVSKTLDGEFFPTQEKLTDSDFPLYTTPTREPLSEEEIEKLVPWQGDPKDPFFNRVEFARAIEQYHGIGTPHEPA